MKQEPEVENLEPTFKVRVLVCPRDESIVAARMARREALVDTELVTAVQAIFARVKEQGDRAVLAATTTHDGVELPSSRVPESEIERAVDELPPELRAAIELARGRIERVNHELVPRDVLREMEPGIRVGELYRPLDFAAACELAAKFAPEHLSIVCRPDRRAAAISSAVAGEVLLGTHTPFSAANYAIGITAVLPTNGAARAVSGITARDMLRTTTLGELDATALEALTPTIATLARYEGLPCHAGAAEARSTPFTLALHS